MAKLLNGLIMKNNFDFAVDFNGVINYNEFKLINLNFTPIPILNKLDFFIAFEKRIDLDKELFFPPGAVRIMLKSMHRPKYEGCMRLILKDDDIPLKRIIKVENSLFINANMVIKDRANKEYILKSELGMIRIPGTILN